MQRNEREHATFERVYFIGAGFSAAMHYPVGQQLMSRLVRYLRGKDEKVERNYVLKEDNGPERARKILRVIERVLKTYFATRPSEIDRVDVSEFFTVAQMLSEGALGSWLARSTTAKTWRSERVDEPSETTLFNDLAAITRSFFFGLSRGQLYTKDVDAVLRLVHPSRDAIINFNWDQDVEIFFKSGKDEDVCYTLGGWQPGRWETLVLKPHGSIGWYDVERGIGNPDTFLIARGDDNIRRNEKRIVAYLNNELPRDLDGGHFHSALLCPPVITAPTFAKRFTYIEQQQIWRDVLAVCGNAKEFIFLGYSMPRDDFLTRAAIRVALSRNRGGRRIRCLIVDRSFEDSKRLNFSDLFGWLSPNRNYLACEFGASGESLGQTLVEKLCGAFVGQSLR